MPMHKSQMLIHLSSRTVEIPADVKEALRKFRFNQKAGHAAISGDFGRFLNAYIPVKIVKASLQMAVDEEFTDMSIEEIAEGSH